MPTPASAPLLEGRDLDTYYGQSHVLRGISIAIRPGETIGLMGRNGMGKTTLIRTLLGLVRARRGSIALDGADVTRLPTFAIAQRGIAYVPEGRGIFASLSVAENLAIAEHGGGAGQADWTTPRILELFPRLAERRDNRGDQLSGGEQRQLEIAMALASDPKVLLLDEPLAGMGPEESQRMTGLLKELARAHAVLLIEHDMDVVFAVADWMTVMAEGTVLAEGKPATIRANTAVQEAYLGGHA
jgi:branched-chain amino acid transport system ATP-binding protein